MTRARYEHQIKHLDTWSGNEFDRAEARVIGRYRNPLEFYTTEQLEDISRQMIRDAWFTHRLNRENRKRRAAA